LQIALQTGAQAIVTMDDQLINFLRARIVELALRHKLPVMSQLRAELHARGFGRRGRQHRRRSPQWPQPTSPSSAGEVPEQRVGRGIGPSGVESRRIRLLRVVFALICAR
jgi:hypothetical protein